MESKKKLIKKLQNEIREKEDLIRTMLNELIEERCPKKENKALVLKFVSCVSAKNTVGDLRDIEVLGVTRTGKLLAIDKEEGFDCSDCLVEKENGDTFHCSIFMVSNITDFLDLIDLYSDIDEANETAIILHRARHKEP